MSIQILGISGSPIPNSNTDRLVKEILKSSGLNYEFIKLSDKTVRPCRACKSCVKDNICKVKDDFQEIAEKLKKADALVIGGYTPYGVLDGYTKAFLERLWSMRHVKSLNENKYVATVISGIMKNSIKTAQNSILMEMMMERAYVINQLKIRGNVPCLTCGYGDPCKNSGVPMLFGKNAKASKDKCIAVENQLVWKDAQQTGKLIGEYIRGEQKYNVNKNKRKMLGMLPSLLINQRWVKSTSKQAKVLSKNNI